MPRPVAVIDSEIARFSIVVRCCPNSEERELYQERIDQLLDERAEAARV